MKTTNRKIGILRTLGIHEVIKQHIVVGVELQGSVVEQVLVDRGADAHVLLAQTTDMGVDVMGVLPDESVFNMSL